MSQTYPSSAGPDVEPGFYSDLDTRLGEEGLWVLLSDLIWVGSGSDTLIIKTGEETDFASVPRLLQALLPSADPRVVRAAVVHDFLCRELNEYHRAQQAPYAPGAGLTNAERHDLLVKAEAMSSPAFSAVDADAIFEKIMRDEGAGWWMRNVGWLGVRLGALWNPARRAGWLSTLPRVAGLSTLFLAAASAILAGLAWLIPL